MRVAVVGMGYVGLSLADALNKAGHVVFGCEKDYTRARDLGEEVPYEVLNTTTGAEACLVGLEAYVVCVPTPTTPAGDPDLSHVREAGEFVGRHIRAGGLAVLESTSYPGTTSGVFRYAVERTQPGSLLVGDTLLLAFSPERVDPGNPVYGVRNTPKLVGGFDKASASAAAHLYRTVCDHVVTVSSMEVAEAAKMLENCYRAVNIALANEFKQLLLTLGIDPHEVVRAAATKPFGYEPFFPGPGVGGHCIAVDPRYMAWVGRQVESTTMDVVEAALKVNDRQPGLVVQRVLRHAGAGARVLVSGVAYKPGTSDIRCSPALEVVDGLLRAGAGFCVDYYDPHVPSVVASAPVWRRLYSVQDPDPADYDCVVVAVKHAGVGYGRYLECKVVVDCVDAYPGPVFPGNVFRS